MAPSFTTAQIVFRRFYDGSSVKITTTKKSRNKEQIRAARQAVLVPLLQKRHLHLTSKEAGNFELTAYPGLIVKESYWRWPQRSMAGNTIDFFVQDLGLSFNNAMREITAS